MTSLREKAREIKAAGEAERGDYTPSGAPLRLYNYWANDRRDRLKSVPERENFCHYWRVVGIWAPLVAVRNALTSNAAEWVYGIVALAALVAAVITGAVVKPILYLYLLGGLAIVYAILSFVIGFAASDDRLADFDSEDRQMFKFFPLAYLTHYVGRGLRKLPEIFWMGIVAILFGALLVFAFIVLVVESGIWVALAVYIGTPVAILAFLAACTGIETLVKGLRARRRDAKIEARNKFLAEGGNEEDLYKPGIVSRFFSGIADFIILIAQVVRVNKWKICPIVTIDSKENDAVNA